MADRDLIALAASLSSRGAVANGDAFILTYGEIEQFAAALSATPEKADERGSAEPTMTQNVNGRDVDYEPDAHLDTAPARDGNDPGLREALERIASMDKEGIRADDLGRAARIAHEAINSDGMLLTDAETKKADEAFDNYYHKVRAEMSRDEWCAKWAQGKTPPQLSLVRRLRDTPNWRRESYGIYEEITSVYDRAPFEAADELERLAARTSAGKETPCE